MAYVKTTWVDDETIVTADNMNHIEDGIKNLESISLLAVSDTAPSECVEGDLYYNTTTKKIYQAIDTNTWDSEGTDPLDKILYIVFSTKTTYSLDENGDLISVGGGGAEIAVSTTEPEEDEKLWFNPNDTPSGSLNPITNEYSVATDKGYSCNYVNNNYGEVIWNNLIGVGLTPQTTNFDLSAYKTFKIYYYMDNHLLDMKTTNMSIGQSITISESDGNLTRNISITTSKLTIEEGKYQGGTNNNAIVISHIVGYK